MNETNDFNVWKDEVPVITITPEQEFYVWQNEAPVADITDTVGPTPVTVSRRRAFEF